jgi:hypothetical protein
MKTESMKHLMIEQTLNRLLGQHWHVAGDPTRATSYSADFNVNYGLGISEALAKLGIPCSGFTEGKTIRLTLAPDAVDQIRHLKIDQQEALQREKYNLEADDQSRHLTIDEQEALQKKKYRLEACYGTGNALSR